MSNYQTNHVLIIDDNDIDNFITQRVLNKFNFTNQVDICTSASKALDYIKLHKDDIEKIPNVIFLDLNMPVVDGFVFLFEFEDFPQAVKDKCKIVVLSSLLDKVAIDKVLRNDFVTDFIPKPLTEAALQRLSLVTERV
jgi:CheY-like chemotaxis protein